MPLSILKCETKVTLFIPAPLSSSQCEVKGRIGGVEWRIGGAEWSREGEEWRRRRRGVKVEKTI